MKHLQAYVDQKNQWSALFGKRQLVIGQDNQKIANALDSDLSPENLTCDGELDGYQIRARHKSLTAAARELIALDPSVKMWEFVTV